MLGRDYIQDVGDVIKGGMPQGLERGKLGCEAEEQCWVSICGLVQVILLAGALTRRLCPAWLPHLVGVCHVGGWAASLPLDSPFPRRQDGPSCLSIFVYGCEQGL